MCGIVGIVANSKPEFAESRISLMLDRVRHRGPDDSGTYFSRCGRCTLGHTRLAILDLSPSGHQPMVSQNSRYVIVFNGEIYNFRDLRDRLRSQGHSFKTESDTEVILAMYEEFGPECVSHFHGMFAIAIWDNRDSTLFLARDAFGIKPLYIWQSGDQLAFASELHSILAAELCPAVLDSQAAFDYFQLGSVPEPWTLVAGIRTLPAGHFQIWSGGQPGPAVRWWSLDFPEEVADPSEAQQLIRKALQESLSRHFVSDVPVGIFLSGGIDSTALVALATKLGHGKLKTFCISFDDVAYDEGPLAARSAKHFGTEHREWKMGADEGIGLAEGFLKSMDRPTSDGFNTYCIARLAAQNGLKVVLSGLGGDEFFAGYPSFERIPEFVRIWRMCQRLGLRRPVSSIIALLSRQPRWRRLAEFMGSEGTVPDAWLAMRGFFTRAEAASLAEHLSGNSVNIQLLSDRLHHHCPAGEDSANSVSRMEIEWYMRNQLLRDSDVMSMKWGLELRVPFVDTRFAESVCRIASPVRLAAGKKLLKDAVPEIPEWVLSQPKKGFRFPFEKWAESCWKEWFQQIDHNSPVPCKTWYRRWCLIAIQHFLDANSIRYSGDRLDKHTV